MRHNIGYKLLSLAIAILVWVYVNQYTDHRGNASGGNVSKVLFISPVTTGKPPYPHKVLDIEVEPQSVTLTGRPARLIEISTVSTEPILLDDRTETFSRRVNLVAPAGTSLADGRTAAVTVLIGTVETAPEVTE